MHVTIILKNSIKSPSAVYAAVLLYSAFRSFFVRRMFLYHLLLKPHTLSTQPTMDNDGMIPKVKMVAALPYPSLGPSHPNVVSTIELSLPLRVSNFVPRTTSRISRLISNGGGGWCVF